MEKKQTAVEWFWNNLTDDMIGDLSPEKIGSIYKLMEQAKQMEKNQIIGAYDREVIDGIQNWFIKDGTKYYELHYEGKNKIEEYNNSGETSRENKTDEK